MYLLRLPLLLSVLSFLAIPDLPLALRFQVAANAQDPLPNFRAHELNRSSEFSSAAVLDVNEDGRLDIVSGAWWYQAPGWEKHRLREVEQIRGRFDDYSNLACDVDGDGDTDILSVNYRSKSLYWSQNPGAAATEAGTLWQRIVIDTPGPSETGRLVDIDGDGRLDILPNGTQYAAWYEILPGKHPEFVRHELPSELIGHGIGWGDINGDGRIDLVCPRGWAEGPVDPRNGRWIFHEEFQLSKDSGIPILVWDVDGDGDSDLVWGRGHNVGLYWTEQVNASSTDWSLPNEDIPESLVGGIVQRRWITHCIDSRFACLHTLLQADLDGDGKMELVAGKRYLGHDGRDPGENDPLSIISYRFRPNRRTWESHPLSLGGSCGIDLDTACADLDGDGDQDLVAPSRSGLHWLENLAHEESRDASARRQHPPYQEHQDLSYFLDKQGQRHPLENALEHGIRRWHILAGMQDAMGEFPDSACRVPLEPKLLEVVDTGPYFRLHITLRVEPERQQTHRLPAFLLIPKDLAAPAPAMLCCHPTHFELGKAQICGLDGKPSRFYAHELALRGFVCLAPDYPSFAEYRDYDFDVDQFESGSMKAVWDNIRCIDLLQNLPCVDADRIGAIGHSLGGHNALFTAAFDQRLRCVISSCGFTAFADYYEGNLHGWTSPRYMPRIREQYGSSPQEVPFDFPEVLAAIAPRPLFVNAPVNDHNFAVAGVRKCEQSVQPLYEMLEKPGNLRIEYPEAEHDFPQSIRFEAYEWLQDHL